MTRTWAWAAVLLCMSGGLPAAQIGRGGLTVSLDKEGACTLTGPDGVKWQAGRLGEARVNGKAQAQPLAACDVHEHGNVIEADYPAGVKVLLRVEETDPRIEVSWTAAPDASIESVRLFDALLSASGNGYAVVPVREGLYIPAGAAIDFTRTFETSGYEGCHMNMVGVVKEGSTALVTWEDPYTAIEVKRATRTISTGVKMRKSARAFTLRLLGQGDWVSIARAYREVARQRGLLVTWDQKLKDHPDDEKYFGASNVKLWSALTRRMNEESTREESVHVNWTFDEAAQVAEHVKNDLKMERVLFTVGGWIRRGYDNQHPDILPAAPECGGDAALADCAKRVMALGYLFCLHDNYQDMYRDAPSFDESCIQRRPDGSLVKGGHWAGGIPYITCSQRAVDLAKRPQNLAAVKKLTGANSYFIDTTYAADLQECFDPKHPLTRADDMRWKQAISDYGREVFGTFGSECGREWAIPHADFFEGLTGVSGTYYHNLKPAELSATVIPLFEAVYRDTIAMFGKYGYNPAVSAEYVLHHISIGRPLNYHSVPGHLYWKQPSPPQAAPRPDQLDTYIRGDGGWTAGLHPYDRFMKNTHEILSPLNQITSKMRLTSHRFLTEDRAVRQTTFGEGEAAVVVTVNGTHNPYTVRDGVVLAPYGFLIQSRTFIAFCAAQYGGVTYATPTLFTLRSLDGQPIAQSARLRVFHAFGDPRIRIGGVERSIEKESLLQP